MEWTRSVIINSVCLLHLSSTHAQWGPEGRSKNVQEHKHACPDSCRLTSAATRAARPRRARANRTEDLMVGRLLERVVGVNGLRAGGHRFMFWTGKARATVRSNITNHAKGCCQPFRSTSTTTQAAESPGSWLHGGLCAHTHSSHPGGPVAGPLGSGPMPRQPDFSHTAAAATALHTYVCDSARSGMLYLDGIQTAWLAFCAGNQRTPLVPYGTKRGEIGIDIPYHGHWFHPCLQLEECTHAYPAPPPFFTSLCQRTQHQSRARHASHVALHTTSSVAACVDCTTQGPLHTCMTTIAADANLDR